jgi:hypothetical protein
VRIGAGEMRAIGERFGLAWGVIVPMLVLNFVIIAARTKCRGTHLPQGATL